MMTSDIALEAARAFKEKLVSDDPSDADLPPSVVVIRQGNQVARVMLSGGSDRFMAVVHTAAAAFGADALVLVTDGYMRTYEGTKDVPDLKRGDLTAMWERGERDGITEVINVVWADRKGDSGSEVAPYVVNGSGLEWTPRPEGFEAQGGFIPETMSEIMALVGDQDVHGLLEMAGVPEALGVNPREARAHADCAAAKYLANQGAPTLLMAFDDTSAEVMRRSFADDPRLAFEVRYEEDDL